MILVDDLLCLQVAAAHHLLGETDATRVPGLDTFVNFNIFVLKTSLPEMHKDVTCPFALDVLTPMG